MTVAVVPRQRGLWLEYIFAVGGVVLLTSLIWTLCVDGYLPQPFFYEPSDTFMDWFNTAYWAHNTGAYDSFGTVYAPLSFVLLRVLGNARCYADAGGLESRSCDWVGLASIHLIYTINVVLVAWTFLKIDRRTAVPRAVALAAGLPMLYALERGNVLLLCFTAVLLGYGPLLRSTRLRWLFAGAAVNLKVYLISALLSQVLKRRWLWVECALIATVVIYVLSYGILGAGTPHEIIGNITSYSSGFIASSVLDLWYPVTYQPLTSMLKGESFPAITFIGSDGVEVGLVVVALLTHLGQLSVVLAALATALRPEVVPTHRVALLGVLLALITSEAGGYTEAIVILFVFMEPWRGIGRPVAIVCCYVLCLPGDISVGYVPPIVRDSFLSGHAVEVHLKVALGMFLRPGVVVAIAVAMSATTIRDVWTDIRQQGWRKRWRFRRDWPLLPGVSRPQPPVGVGETTR